MNWMFQDDPWPDYSISNCCGARLIDETDLCSRCKEHAGIEFPHSFNGEVDDDDYGDFKFHEKRDIEACEREE